MKLTLQVLVALDRTDPYRVGRCDVAVVQAEHTVVVASGLEFGEVFADSAGTRSLSEFEVTLFAVVAPGEPHRVRVRRKHCYEAGTESLRDVWLALQVSRDGAVVAQPSSPMPLSAVTVLATAAWAYADALAREPMITEA
ncbi:MAG: hypothetical protein Q8Q09_03610 [Deltaproteobacteria bacterium]|nr:hypothetical protein [Deltaproteobacteria bacterium]